MEARIVQSVVTRCKIVDIRNVIMRWGLLENHEIEEIDFKDTKREIATSIIVLCEVM